MVSWINSKMMDDQNILQFTSSQTKDLEWPMSCYMYTVTKENYFLCWSITSGIPISFTLRYGSGEITDLQA